MMNEVSWMGFYALQYLIWHGAFCKKDFSACTKLQSNLNANINFFQIDNQAGMILIPYAWQN